MNAIARERKCKLKLLRCPHNTRKTEAKESQGAVSVECGAIRAPRSGWWECKLAQQLWKLCLGIQSDYR